MLKKRQNEKQFFVRRTKTKEKSWRTIQKIFIDQTEN